MAFSREKHVFSKEIMAQIEPLRALDNWHGVMAVFYDYAVIIAAMLLCKISWWCLPVSLLLIGSRQRALATVLHESVHCCLTKSRKLNWFLGTYMSGYLIFQEYNTYRDSHVKNHHAFLGDPQRDPDYIYHLEEELYHYHGCWGFFKRYILKPLILQKAASYLEYLIYHRMKPSQRYWRSFAAMFVYWGVITGIAWVGNLMPYLALWWIGLFTTSAMIGWFNELSEHYPLVGKHSIDLYMTRNRFSHWLEHFLFNMHAENYHLIHHLQASIPFWNLKKAHVILCQDEKYAQENKKMGGIFISKNGNPSLIKKLLSEPSVNVFGKVQYE